jgi:hypothetical protein
MSLAIFLTSREERRSLAVAARPQPALGERQLDEGGNGKIRTHRRLYRNGKEVLRSEKRILEDEIEIAIPDEKAGLRWYRER